jgi:hypothetical protein
MFVNALSTTTGVVVFVCQETGKMMSRFVFFAVFDNAGDFCETGIVGRRAYVQTFKSQF